MKFTFHLVTCASGNSPVAKSRESQRLACVALGMSLLGHDVVIADVSPEFQQSRRWAPFSHLYRPALGPGGFHVYPAEFMRGRQNRVDVAFKCSVGIQNDQSYLGRCQLLVAHEYDSTCDDRPNLLPVPFMVHDSMMDVFLDDGMFGAFIANDIAAIRNRYGGPKTGLLGMRACTHYPRRQFCENHPAWADLQLYEYQPTGGFEPPQFIPWIASFMGGLCLPGTTPKTNLPSLLALLGVAIVAPPFPKNCRDTPPLSRTNSIIFESWDQVWLELQDAETLEAVVAQATSDYINCWSPQGQARLIAERLS